MTLGYTSWFNQYWCHAIQENMVFEPQIPNLRGRYSNHCLN